MSAGRAAPHWWGSCDSDDCAITVMVEVSRDSPMAAIPDPDGPQWDMWFSGCPVCGDNFHWGGAERASWDNA